MPKQHVQRRKPKNAKLTGGAKVAIATVATTALIGGWNAVGHLEAASIQTSALAGGPTVALIVPTSLPTIGAGAGPSAASIVLPAIPPLTIDPIPTLALGSSGAANAGSGVVTGGAIASAAVSAPAIPTMAPPALPALAPLPDLPSMPAPPPPPPARSGGGKKSSGS